jgi:hypothetical protein
MCFVKVSLPRDWRMIFGNTLEISQANVFPKTRVSLPVEKHKTGLFSAFHSL